MSVELKPRVTSEEYLALERKAERKSEYFNGEIFAMSGASPQHVLIVTNVVSELRGQLKTRPCTVYSTDLRLKVSATGLLYTYPDVIVVCGEPQFDDDHKDTLLNPALIVEVYRTPKMRQCVKVCFQEKGGTEWAEKNIVMN